MAKSDIYQPLGTAEGQIELQLRSQVKALEKRLEAAEKRAEAAQSKKAELEAIVLEQAVRLEEWAAWADDADDKNRRLTAKNLKLQEAFAQMDAAFKKSSADHWEAVKALDELERITRITDLVALAKPDELWAKKEGKVNQKQAYNWLHWQSELMKGRKKGEVFEEFTAWVDGEGLPPRGYKTFQRNAIDPVKDA